jgi:hypothetical protein
MRRPDPLRGAALALALLLGGEAAAQSAVGNLGRERRRDRQVVLPSAPEEKAEAEVFGIDLVLPLLYTDAATGAGETAVAPLRRGDLRLAPDLMLSAGRQFEDFQLAAQAGASLNRFRTERDADFDLFYGGVEAALSDGGSDLFVPYAGYDATVEYERGFATRLATLHDLYLGVWSAAGLGPDSGVIAYRDAYEPGAIAFAIDAGIGRRLADPADFANLFADLTLELTYVASERVSLALVPGVVLRRYDDFFGAERRDALFTAALSISWRPDWLAAINEGAELGFSAQLLRNWSNLPEERFTDWEFGPVLALSWRF